MRVCGAKNQGFTGKSLLRLELGSTHKEPATARRGNWKKKKMRLKGKSKRPEDRVGEY